MRENWFVNLVFGKRGKKSQPEDRSSLPDVLSSRALDAEVDRALVAKATERRQYEVTERKRREDAARHQRELLEERRMEVYQQLRSQVHESFTHFSTRFKDLILESASEGSNHISWDLVRMKEQYKGVNGAYETVRFSDDIPRFGYEAVKKALVEAPGYEEFVKFCRQQKYRVGLYENSDYDGKYGTSNAIEDHGAGVRPKSLSVEIKLYFGKIREFEGRNDPLP